MGHWSLRLGTFGPLFQQFLKCNHSDILIYFGSFWYQNNGDPLHFSETNVEPLAASSRDFIEQNVNFASKVPNLPYPVNRAFNMHLIGFLLRATKQE